MSRWLLIPAIAVAAAACATEPDPTPKSDEAPVSPLIFRFGYTASLLPLTQAAAINATGAIVGKVGTQAVYYASGAITNLASVSTVNSVTPVDLANDGKILARGDGPQGPKALLYFSPATSPIDIAAPLWAEPYALNNAGVAVGRYGRPGFTWRAFRWTGTTGMVDITPAGYELGWATDISEAGFAIGWIQSVNTVSNARWNAGAATVAIVPKTYTMNQALDGGSVLVWAPGIGSAAWSIWGTFALGPDPAHLRVQKISPNGRLVGTYLDAASGRTRGWTSINGGSATYLPTPAGILDARPFDVNACGTILGRGVDQNNAPKVIVWSKPLICDTGPILATF